MATEENKQEVLDWIQSGCNYEQGAEFYNQFGKNSFLKKDFPGKQHKHATKIIYELCKSIGLDYAQLQREKLIPEIAEEVIKKLPSTASRVRLSTHSKLYTKIYFWMVGNPSRDFFDRSTICENIANGLTNGCDEGYGCAFGSNGRKLVADIRI